jgi:hypothetical protein
MQIFKTSFIQVFLVSINTICLSKGLYFGVALFGFLISWFWVTNVKKADQVIANFETHVVRKKIASAKTIEKIKTMEAILILF